MVPNFVHLSSIHAEKAAQLHIAGQPGTFLTNLGPQVLTVLYRALPQSTTGFGVAAIDSSATDPSDALLGFVAATTGIGRLFLDLGTRHIAHFAPPLLRRFSQQPRLFWQSLQTLFYPFLHKAERGELGGNDLELVNSGDNSGDNSHNIGQVAELLAIMVDPANRDQGIGAELLSHLFDACIARNCTAIDVTVAADNLGARRFYERHGFTLQSSFMLYGRNMCSYRLPDLLERRFKVDLT